jgi:hypothetical protein
MQEKPPQTILVSCPSEKRKTGKNRTRKPRTEKRPCCYGKKRKYILNDALYEKPKRKPVQYILLKLEK